MYIATTKQEFEAVVKKYTADETIQSIICDRLLDNVSYNDISKKYFNESPASMLTKIQLSHLMREFQDYYNKNK